MSWLGNMWLLCLILHSGYSQRLEESILDIVNSTNELSEFAKFLQIDGLHRALLDRQVSLFAPTNAAMARYQGRATESLILNHMTNIALMVEQLPEKMTSLVTGNPPLWITEDRNGIFVNQARIVRENIRARSSRGDEQVLHMIDSVLEPLVPTSVREAEYFVQLDARKLLSQSTLYNLRGKRTRTFFGQAEFNQKTHMFGVPGQHTFFIPIDDAFESVDQNLGYDYERNRLKSTVTSTISRVGTKIQKDLVDKVVLEGHIVPHKMLFTSHAPTQEYPTVAWLPKGIQVNVSLQLTGFQSSSDSSFRNPNLDNPGRISYSSYSVNQDGDETLNQDQQRALELQEASPVVVRSNTIVGDRVHPRGMVVARIVQGNIPVQNGVVHLIDKPLMVVANSLYEYIMSEGKQPGNRLSMFAKLLRDKGGLFMEAILEAKDGTILAPSNEAMEKVDTERLDFVLGNDYLRAEMLGLHFVRERIVSSDYRLQKGGDQTFSSPASLANNRVWFHYDPKFQFMTVEGRGVNATVVEKDIGTINGVIHVVDRVLGIPYQTCGERINSDPNMSHMASMLRQLRLDALFSENPRQSPRRYTIVVPSNDAWEKAQLDFSKAYNTILEGQFPDYGRVIMQRHFKVDERPLTFEELIELSRRTPSREVPMASGELTFNEQGEFSLNAYKENFVGWKDVNGKVIRPNMECTNGIIHLVDTVFMDDAPPWAVGDSSAKNHSNWGVLLSLLSLNLWRFYFQ